MNLKEENFKQTQIILNLVNIKKYDEVISKSKSLIKKFPSNYIYYNALSLAYINKQEFNNSLLILRNALKLFSDNIYVLNNLGLTLFHLQNYDEAEQILNTALKLNPNFIDSLVNLGNLKRKINLTDEALVIYKKGLEKYDHNFMLHYLIGNAYQTIGDFEKSTFHHTKCLKINPKFTIADRELSVVTKYKKDNEHLKLMENKIKNLDLNNVEKIHLNFALGKAYENLKNYDNAFLYYKNANFEQHKISNFQIKNDEKLFNNIKNYFDNNSIKNIEDSSQKIIFIVGMPRSGTTLVEQILSSHNKIYGAGELEFLTDILKKKIFDNELYNLPKKFYEADKNIFNKVQYEYLSNIKKFNADSEYVVDKAPLNFRWIGYINYIFPNSKIIHCKRNPMDICWSNFKHHFSSKALSYSYNQSILGEFYNLYSDLMNYWNNKFPNKIYEVCYEDLIRNKDEKIKKLIKFCNLEWNPKCLDFHNNKKSVNTASLSQVRQPIYKSSVKSWEPFSKHLSELEKIIKK